MCVLFLSGCLMQYRPDEQSGNIPREVIERERDLLVYRMQEWEEELRTAYEQGAGAAERAGLLNRKLARGRQVLNMFDRKLETHGEMILFTREEWRQAMHVGCQRYR